MIFGLGLFCLPILLWFLNTFLTSIIQSMEDLYFNLSRGRQLSRLTTDFINVIEIKENQNTQSRARRIFC
jgi:hypothetical protein